MPFEEQPDRTVLGEELTTFLLQPGFVEGITETRKRYYSIEEAYKDIFQYNKEYAIILWCGIPVRLSYTEDVPSIAEDVINMLSLLIKENVDNSASVIFETSNLNVEWNLIWGREFIEIKSEWKKITGGYEDALNLLHSVKMPKQDFLCEWKLLLEQLARALQDAEANIRNKKAMRVLKDLNDLIALIPKRGKFYRYEERA